MRTALTLKMPIFSQYIYIIFSKISKKYLSDLYFVNIFENFLKILLKFRLNFSKIILIFLLFFNFSPRFFTPLPLFFRSFLKFFSHRKIFLFFLLIILQFFKISLFFNIFIKKNNNLGIIQMAGLRCFIAWNRKAIAKNVRLKFVREDNALYRLANTLGYNVVHQLSKECTANVIGWKLTPVQHFF